MIDTIQKSRGIYIQASAFLFDCIFRIVNHRNAISRKQRTPLCFKGCGHAVKIVLGEFIQARKAGFTEKGLRSAVDELSVQGNFKRV